MAGALEAGKRLFSFADLALHDGRMGLKTAAFSAQDITL